MFNGKYKELKDDVLENMPASQGYKFLKLPGFGQIFKANYQVWCIKIAAEGTRKSKASTV